MTENSDADRTWDEELNKLVDGVLDDSAGDVPEDVVDAADLGATGEDADSVTPFEKDMAELLAERTLDLQRLQAEYVNYKRRVDRDRDVARQRGIEAVLADLLPVLDGIDAARAHEEMTPGATMLADEVAKVATKYGLTSFAEEGDPFDPHIHEALMHVQKPGYAVESVAQVFQKGYAIKDRIVRPARVGVADPDESLLAQPGAADPSPASTSPVSADAPADAPETPEAPSGE